MRLQLLLSAALFVVATVASAENLQKVAETHEREFIATMKSGKFGWFEKVAAPDFHETDMKGHKTARAASLRMMKQTLATTKIGAAKATVMKVTKTKSGMVVRSHVTVSMSMMDPSTKKMSKFDNDGVYEETWTKRNGVWQIHEYKSINEKMTVNGKPVSG